MRKVSYKKFKLLIIFAIFLLSTGIVGCRFTKNMLSNNDSEEKSISVQVTESTVIKFPDKNLEKIIREKIQCPTGDILKDDVDKITEIGDSEGKHITNLSGIENLTNLTLLNLSNNHISNIEPLKELTMLTNLNLASNQMSNIEPLKGLTKLTSLNLNTNKISNIEALKGLTNLTDLNLDTNETNDIEPLKGLTRLTYLNLDSNNIRNIEPLKGLAKLADLNLDTNQIKNYSLASDYSKNPKKTDVVSVVTEPKTKKGSSVCNQVVENSAVTFPNSNIEKILKVEKQDLPSDIIKEDEGKITSPKNLQDKPVANIAGTDNSTTLSPGANETCNVEPLK